MEIANPPPPPNKHHHHYHHKDKHLQTLLSLLTSEELGLDVGILCSFRIYVDVYCNVLF